MMHGTTKARSAPTRNFPPGRWLGWGRDWDAPYAQFFGFLLIVAQTGALWVLIDRFQLEDDIFQTVVRVALVGFLVHHFIPSGWRLPFFSALSLGTIAYVLGLDKGTWSPALSLQRTTLLVGIGLALIGICHLPLRLGLRVGLLLLAGAALAVLRGGLGSFTPLQAIWPVLGAMFMFRLIVYLVYLYDMEEDQGHEPARLSRTLSYFFLFPNLWLFVFPVLDYKTFHNTYFNDRPLAIYQKGVEWMMRGVIHLLLWRLVYYQYYLDPSRVEDGAGLVQFMVSNVALYLRVSGQFHFVIGLLHLFGFNLPETNRRYFLASSFTDYWRRVNIYWKDFIINVFYYPLVVQFKSWGKTGSVVAATAVAFLATWLLHSYQWFWLRGNFPLEPKDALFWGILGVLVCLNSFREMKDGGQRPRGSKSTLADSAGLALRTAATFLVITLLWSIWSCDSLSQWLGLWQYADRQALVYALAVLALIGAAAVALERNWRATPGVQPGKLSAEAKIADAGPLPWRKAAVVCFIPAIALMGARRLYEDWRPDVRVVVESLWKNTPNKTDEELMVRGYYENLMDTNRFHALASTASTGQPAGWRILEDTDAVRNVADLRNKELVPSKDTVVNDKLISTNTAGMRDREYDIVKLPGTCRMALLGSSIVMGWNVNQDEVFEAVLEERLNQELRSSPAGRYEILNFALNGYSPVALLDVLDRKALAFRPDAVLFVSHPEDPTRATREFSKTVRMGGDLRYDFLKQLAARAGISSKTPASWSERQLIRHETELLEWSYRQAADTCRQNGITPVWVYLPGVLAQGRTDIDARLMGFAKEAGFVVITLFDLFKGTDRAQWMVAPWDAHPNAKGHKVIADALLEVLKTPEGLEILRPHTVAVTARRGGNVSE